MPSAKIQRVCFTLNNYDDVDIEDCDKLMQGAAYAIVGKEVGECGTKHLQGFVNFGRKNRKSFMAIKAMIPRAHIEIAKGSDEDNRKYCSKEGDFKEVGEPQTCGKRNDLKSVTEQVLSGKRVADVALEYPGTFVKYCRGIRELSYIVRSQIKRDYKTEVYVLIGKPGTGKSRFASERAAQLGSVYYKPRGEWWDGYDGETSVIIDDYYGWLKYDELLKIMDRYPYQVPVKGGYVGFTSKYIFITSNAAIENWYKFPNYTVDAIMRRIEHLHIDFIPAIPPPDYIITQEEEDELFREFYSEERSQYY